MHLTTLGRRPNTRQRRDATSRRAAHCAWSHLRALLHRRRARWPLVLWHLMLATLLTSSCERSAPRADALASTDLLRAHQAHWPGDAQLLVSSPRLDWLPETLRQLDTLNPPLKLALASACASWRAISALDLCDAAAQERAGLASAAPASLFISADGWGLIASRRALDQAQPWPLQLAGRPDLQVEALTLAGTSAHLVRAGPEPIAAIALTPTLMIAVSAWPAPSDEAQLIARLTHLLRLPPEARWDANAAHRDLFGRLHHDESVFVAASPSSWLGALPATQDQAKTLRARMQAQSGPIGVALRRDATGALRARVRALEDVEEPATLHGLGQATGQLGPLGALVTPGALAAVRVSLDTRRLFTLIRSTLPASQRAELDARLRQLRELAAIDLEEALIDNLHGHAVIVLYGLGLDALDLSQPLDAARELLMLSASREAIILPLRDRHKLARLLDALTQLTQGRLRRQDLGQVVHYAWMVEGELRWALVLHDEALLIVDNTATFRHAMNHVQRPRPLRAAQLALGLGRLLDDEADRSGLYVDLQALWTVLPDAWRAHPLLSPFAHMRHALLTVRARERSAEAELELSFKAP